jgi:hypothetical protein
LQQRISSSVSLAVGILRFEPSDHRQELLLEQPFGVRGWLPDLRAQGITDADKKEGRSKGHFFSLPRHQKVISEFDFVVVGTYVQVRSMDDEHVGFHKFCEARDFLARKLAEVEPSRVRWLRTL